MIPDMDQAAAQGWNVFFWAFDQQVNPAVKWLVYLVVFARSFSAAWRRSPRLRG